MQDQFWYNLGTKVSWNKAVCNNIPSALLQLSFVMQAKELLEIMTRLIFLSILKICFSDSTSPVPVSFTGFLLNNKGAVRDTRKPIVFHLLRHRSVCISNSNQKKHWLPLPHGSYQQSSIQLFLTCLIYFLIFYFAAHGIRAGRNAQKADLCISDTKLSTCPVWDRDSRLQSLLLLLVLLLQLLLVCL